MLLTFWSKKRNFLICFGRKHNVSAADIFLKENQGTCSKVILFFCVDMNQMNMTLTGVCNCEYKIPAPLKVSKFQKQVFLFSFGPKNKRNYILNSALASKISHIKKMKTLYYIN